MRTVDAQAKPVNIQCELLEPLLLWFLSKKFLYYFTLYVLFLQTSRSLCSNAKADIMIITTGS